MTSNYWSPPKSRICHVVWTRKAYKTSIMFVLHELKNICGLLGCSYSYICYMYYTGDRFVESHGNNRHVVKSCLVVQWLTHFTKPVQHSFCCTSIINVWTFVLARHGALDLFLIVAKFGHPLLLMWLQSVAVE